MKRFALILLALSVAGAAPDERIARPQPLAQTDPVPNDGDAADDPAIWLHPTDPARSLILGTDKRGALHMYDLDGKRLGMYGTGTQPNNVDVLYGFALGDRKVDLAIADGRGAGWVGVKLWAIDGERRELTDVTAGKLVRVHRGGEPYGVCTYRSRKTGKAYFFVGSKTGHIEQHELSDAGGGKVAARRVRSLRVGSTVEGCVADNDAGVVFVGEEAAGIWRFDAEPDAPPEGKLVARVGEHGLTADVEGLALYEMPDGAGYLVASSQGNATFKVYDRAAPHRFVGTIDPAAGKSGDDVSDTDGVAVTSVRLSDRYPRGMMVVQDGEGPKGRQNFKIYSWADVEKELRPGR